MISSTAKKLLQEYGIDDVPERCVYFKDAVDYILSMDLTFRAESVSIDTKRWRGAFLRFYQRQCIQDSIVDDKLQSGIIVVPCGGGKTHIGCSLSTLVNGLVLILTITTKSAIQWYNTISSMDSTKCITCIISGSESKDVSKADIIITTYGMFLENNHMISVTKVRRKDLIIADESHRVVAKNISKQILKTHKKCIIGFTATNIREDDEMKHLPNIIGPQLSNVPLSLLVEHKFISNVKCKTIHVLDLPNTSLLTKDLTHTQKVQVSVLNKNKIHIFFNELRKLLSDNKKVIVLNDDISTLHILHNYIKVSFEFEPIGPIDMSSNNKQRTIAENQFRGSVESMSNNVLLAGRALDEAWDANADAIIQLCTSWGSRRQYQQRIGRVQRPSQRNNFEAESITISTLFEEKYVEHRDKYLESEGYSVTQEYYNTQFGSENDLLEIIDVVKNLNKRKRKKDEK